MKLATSTPVNRMRRIAWIGRSFALAALSGLVIISAPGPAGAQLTAAPTAPSWPQLRSDLPADPDVLFGQLANGMRYAVQKNTLPPGQVSMRFLIDAGSNHEAPGQEGLAHFLEHMAFRGSAKVAENQMVVILQRLGLSFGGDTNASTSARATVYQLDLPHSDAETVGTGLMLFREIASELTLSQAAMDAERGVLLSEERSRASPSARVSEALSGFVFEGHPMARPTIGKTEVLSTAPVSRIRAFYEAYYRPERATLVVVGDIDAAVLETSIREAFSDWKGKGPAGADPPANFRPRGSAVRVVAEPGAAPGFNLFWRAPADQEPEGKAKETRALIEILAFRAFNQRLSDIARAPQPPFLGGGGASSNYRDIVRLTQLNAGIAKMEDWSGAMDALIRTQRQALQFGLRQDELDRAITVFRTSLQSAVAANGTRRSPNIANSLINVASSRGIYTSAATDLALFEEIVAGLKLETVNAALRSRFTGDGPLVMVAGPSPVEGGEAAVNTKLAQALATPVTALAAEQTRAWTHTDFGSPGTVGERRELSAIGTTFLRFANGVRLTIKPTKFAADQIVVSVAFGDGQQALPTDKISPVQLWGGLFIEGGLTDMTAVERQRALTGRRVSVSVGTGEESFIMSGVTRPADLELQMQLMAAYFTAPGWRTEAFDKMRTTIPTVYASMETSPGAIFSRESGAFLHSGDQRWADPGADGMMAMKLEDARTFIEPIMATAPMEIVMVGDLDVEAAIQAVAKTFGALPQREARKPPPAKALDVRFPDPPAQPIVWRHKGRADQALAVIAWPTTGFYRDVRAPRAARVLQLVMQIRLTDALRISQGQTYSPQTGSLFSTVYPDYGSISVLAEVKPDAMAAFYDAVDKIVADLRSADITPDELDRAKKPRIEALTQQMTTNAYWLSVLSGAQEDPRKLDVITETVPMMQSITIADVRKAAQDWLVKEKSVRMSVLPETDRVASGP